MSLTIKVENNPLAHDITLSRIFQEGYVLRLVPNPVDDNPDGDVVVVGGGDTAARVQAWDLESEGGIGPVVYVDFEDITEITIY